MPASKRLNGLVVDDDDVEDDVCNSSVCHGQTPQLLQRSHHLAVGGGQSYPYHVEVYGGTTVDFFRIGSILGLTFTMIFLIILFLSHTHTVCLLFLVLCSVLVVEVVE